MSFNIINAAKKEYLLAFTFKRQSCDVHLSVKNISLLHIESLTDGYHWLSFFLSQDPGVNELCFLERREQIKKINESLQPLGIRYEPEDKETGFLHLTKAFNDLQLNTICSFLDERFAIREKFYE